MACRRNDPAWSREACDRCGEARKSRLGQSIPSLIEYDLAGPAMLRIGEPALNRLPADQFVAESGDDQDDWKVRLEPVVQVFLFADVTEAFVGLLREAPLFSRFQLRGNELGLHLSGSGIAKFEETIDARLLAASLSGSRATKKDTRPPAILDRIRGTSSHIVGFLARCE